MVIPVYNEAHRFNSEYWEAILSIPKLQLIFVIDGAKDESSKIFSNLCSGTEHRIIDLPQNVGKAEAIRTGFRHTLKTAEVGDLIGFMDADPAFEAQNLSSMFVLAENLLVPGDTKHQAFEALWASRVALSGHNINRLPIRHYIGRIINTILGTFIPEIPYDTQCGFKVFLYSPKLDVITTERFKTKWFIDLELMLRWKLLEKDRTQMRIWEEPLSYWEDVAGSSLSPKNAVQVLREMFRIIKLARLASS